MIDYLFFCVLDKYVFLFYALYTSKYHFLIAMSSRNTFTLKSYNHFACFTNEPDCPQGIVLTIEGKYDSIYLTIRCKVPGMEEVEWNFDVNDSQQMMANSILAYLDSP